MAQHILSFCVINRSHDFNLTCNLSRTLPWLLLLRNQRISLHSIPLALSHNKPKIRVAKLCENNFHFYWAPKSGVHSAFSHLVCGLLRKLTAFFMHKRRKCIVYCNNNETPSICVKWQAPDQAICDDGRMTTTTMVEYSIRLCCESQLAFI